jgi:hypothetical protein
VTQQLIKIGPTKRYFQLIHIILQQHPHFFGFSPFFFAHRPHSFSDVLLFLALALIPAMTYGSTWNRRQPQVQKINQKQNDSMRD